MWTKVAFIPQAQKYGRCLIRISRNPNFSRSRAASKLGKEGNLCSRHETNLFRFQLKIYGCFKCKWFLHEANDGAEFFFVCRQTVRQKKLDLINVKAKPTDRVVKPTKICCRLYYSGLHCEHNVTYFYYYNASDYIMSTIMWSSAAFFLRFPLKTGGEKMRGKL